MHDRHDLAFDDCAVYCMDGDCDFYAEGDDILELIKDGLRYRATSYAPKPSPKPIEKPIIVEVDQFLFGVPGVPMAIDIIPPSPADRDQRALIVLGEAFQDDRGHWRFRQDARPWNYLLVNEVRDLAVALLAAADEAEKVGS